MRKTIVIIGAGASGMMSAISASRFHPDAKIVLLEKEKIAGKKLALTGNGKCNLTNESITADDYHSHDETFPSHILHTFSGEDTKALFEELGLLLTVTDGRVYPLMKEAKSVRDILFEEVKNCGVSVHLNTVVTAIHKGTNDDHCLSVEVDSGYSYPANAVILAAGTKAGPAQADGPDGCHLAEALSLETYPLFPSLVQLRSDDPCFTKLAGIRTQAAMKLYREEFLLAEEEGELQLTDYGVSGIPIFQLSGIAAEELEDSALRLVIDFLPTLSQDSLTEEITRQIRRMQKRSIGALLRTFFPQKLIPVLLEHSHIKADTVCTSIEEETIRTLTQTCKAFSVSITGTNSFAQAQICRGGVDVTQIDRNSLEVTSIPGLHICGEVLDVDGRCGGYNLQWAFSSGFIAGKNALS